MNKKKVYEGGKSMRKQAGSHRTDEIQNKIEMRSKYIKKLITDIEISSDDTLNLARQYLPHSGLYLPVLDMLIVLRQRVMEEGDLQTNQMMISIQNDLILHLKRRLKEIEKGLTIQSDSQSELTELIWGILTTAAIIINNEAVELTSDTANSIKHVISRLEDRQIRPSIEGESTAEQDFTPLIKNLTNLETALTENNFSEGREILARIQQNLHEN